MGDVKVNELVVWQYDTPVVNADSDGEFYAWQQNVFSPDADRDEGTGEQRRRASEF